MNFINITPTQTPSAWVDLDALDKNIAVVNSKLNHPKNNSATLNNTAFDKTKINLRLATKSIRSIAVLKYLKKHSPNYIGLMSYSAEESAYLLDNGFNNILCAYPSLDADNITKTFCHVNHGATMIWMVDRIEHWQLLNILGKSHNVSVQICLDINMSMPLPKLYFGTKRSSLMYKKQLKKLLKQAKNLTYAKVVGLMGYEGQIAGLPEHIPHKAILTPAIRLLKNRSKKQVSKRRGEMVKLLQKHKLGADLQLVNGGGSGSLDFTCSQPEVTEVTVGSAYYYPALFSNMDSMDEFTPATGFVLQVTRQPENNVITCHGGGFVASGAMGEDKFPVVHYPNNLKILSDEGFGEVQTPMLFTDGKPSVKIGDYVWCRHAKAGELCEHFNELVAYRDGNVVDSFSTYRGNGKVFH